MSLCAANSGPLSVVIVFRLFLYGSSSFLTTFARGFDSFPNGSFCISNILVDFSTIVSMACWAGGDDQVHLKISKSLPVNFFTSFMDTHPVLYWKMSAFGTMPVFHLMPCVFCKFPCCVIVDDVIDGLVGYLYALIYAQIFVLETTGRW